MKTDFYTKSVLSLIAACLSILVLKEVDLIPKAYAGATFEDGTKKENYALVPLNADGSIDVNIVDINTYDVLDVNIEEVGGYSTYGALPVEME